MQTENRMLDDFAKFVNGVAGTMAGMGREAESALRSRAREFMGGVDFVSREEFDAVKDMAANARAEAEALRARIVALEEQVQRGTRSDATPAVTRARKAAPVKDGPGAPKGSKR